MSSSVPTAARTCRHLVARTQKRSLSSQCLIISSSATSQRRRDRLSSQKQCQQHQQRQIGRRWQSTDAGAAAAPTNPKISGIVDQISQLTLLETADLVASLKSRLNIPDMAFAAPSSGPPGSAPAAAPVEEDEPAPAAQEKTLFNLKLESFEAGAKPKVIKEVKSMLGLSLVDSKKFVESAPKMLKESVPKEDAEKIIATLKALGAVVSMD